MYSTGLIHRIIQENSLSPNPTCPMQWSGLTHGSPRTCRTGRPRCVRGRPERLASWETRRASRNHAEGFLFSGSRMGHITIPHAGPITLHRSMTRWGELHQLSCCPPRHSLIPGALPPSLSLSLSFGVMYSSAPQERGGGDWEPLYFSPLLSLSALAPPLSVSLSSVLLSFISSTPCFPL